MVKPYETAIEHIKTTCLDGRKWISVETPPAESGKYTCVVRDGGEPYEASRNYLGEGKGWHSFAEVLFYLPETTPPIPEMPKYEWSPTSTPVGAVVRYFDHLEGLVRAVVVVEWVDNYVHVRRPTEAYDTWGPGGQGGRPIRNIELPKPAPNDPRLVNFVEDARELFSAKWPHHHNHHDWYMIDLVDTKATLRLLAAAEEALDGSQPLETPEPDAQLHAEIKELLAVCEMADELAQQAVPVKRFTGHPGDDRVNASSAASEYTVLELHDLALAARVKAALAEVTGR